MAWEKITYNVLQLGEVQEFESMKLNSDSGYYSLYFAKLLVIGSGKMTELKLNNDMLLVAFVFLCCGAFLKF